MKPAGDEPLGAMGQEASERPCTQEASIMAAGDVKPMSGQGASRPVWCQGAGK